MSGYVLYETGIQSGNSLSGVGEILCGLQKDML